MKMWMGLITMLAIFAASPALAGGEEGFYFGAGYIHSEVDTGISALTGTAELDDDDTGFKIFAGYQLNFALGIELTYSDFGEASLMGNNGDTFNFGGTTYTIIQNNSGIYAEAWALSLGGAFSLPLETITGVEILKWITPYAKLGGFYWEIDFSGTSNGLNASIPTIDGFDIYFGGGIAVNLHENLVITGEWLRFKTDDAIDSLSANVMIRF